MERYVDLDSAVAIFNLSQKNWFFSLYVVAKASYPGRKMYLKKGLST